MTVEDMKLAVMGTGGVGGYFGARLAAAGARVSFIARGEHLGAIRERGLRVLSALGDVTIAPAVATADAAEIGPVDVVLFAVKLYDTEGAGADLGPLIGKHTAVLSLQNGVDAEDQLAALVGREHVMGGAAQISALIESPGVSRHNGAFAKMIFGELDGRRTARAERLLEACQGAGIDAVLADDIVKELWGKFVFLAAMSALTSLARLPFGPILKDAGSRALLTEALAEVVAVGRAKGVNLDPDVVEHWLAIIDTMPATMKTSMQQDLERGNRLEVAYLSGAVARLGAELGVDTPIHRTAFALLELHAEGRAGTAS